MRICLTGGIACGKSLFARFLEDCGVDCIDADDVVHALVPAGERARLAPILFADPAARKAHEARIWPLVRARIREAFDGASTPLLAIVPLVYEAGWEGDFDFIACLSSTPALQLARMMETRGLSEEAARARLAAQMPVAEKAARADFVIENNGTAEELREKARAFARRMGELGFAPRAPREGALRMEDAGFAASVPIEGALRTEDAGFALRAPREGVPEN